MELQKALATLKAVADDSVANGRFRNMDEVAAVTEAYNTIVSACNFAASVKNQNQDVPKAEAEAILESGEPETAESA
jgi:hypothetical protein